MDPLARDILMMLELLLLLDPTDKGFEDIGLVQFVG